MLRVAGKVVPVSVKIELIFVAIVLRTESRFVPTIYPAVPAPYAPGKDVLQGSPAAPAALRAYPVVPPVKCPERTSSQTASQIAASITL